MWDREINGSRSRDDNDEKALMQVQKGGKQQRTKGQYLPERGKKRVGDGGGTQRTQRRRLITAINNI